MPSEDVIAEKLSRDGLFDRAIIAPYNYVMNYCNSHGLDGNDTVVVDSVFGQAIAFWSESAAARAAAREARKG